MKLTMMRNTHGLHAPIRMLMERRIVAAVSILYKSRHPLLIAPQNPHMSLLPQTNLHLDILMGRDETIETADVFAGKKATLTSS